MHSKMQFWNEEKQTELSGEDKTFEKVQQKEKPFKHFQG